MTRESVVLMAALSALVAFQSSACSTRECGKGTVDKNGECVAENVGGTECGNGTHLDPSTLLCLPDEYSCDPNTAFVTDAGVCMGRVTDSLPQPLPCPQVAADEICISGWLRDFDNKGKASFSRDTLITDGSAEIWVFDPFKVLLCSAPPCFDTSQAIAGPFYAAADGTFLLSKDVTDRPIKATGTYVALGVKNKDNTPQGDRDWAEAGITADGRGGVINETFDLFAVSKAQTAAWEANAPGIISRGVFVMMWHYLNAGEPDFSKNRTFVPGVLPNRSPTPIDLGSLYFMTTDRNTLEAGSSGGTALTTDIGGAMLVQESLGYHAATGGNVPGSDPPVAIDWEPRLGASVPGLVFLQFFNQKP